MSIVVVRLIGGLGNQMFQYAVGRTVAESVGSPLFLDVGGFQEYGLRRYELDGFNISAGLAGPDELSGFGLAASKQGLLYRVIKRMGFSKRGTILREASFSYDGRVESVVPPAYLDGYWQSEKYFSHLSSIIRSEFTLREDLDAENTEMLRNIAYADGNAVSLHIRRGDYVSNPHTAQYHGVCPLDYYRAAVSYVAGRVSHPHFFVFSDDHEWVREQFDVGYPMTLVQVNGPDRGINDMMLMKSCQHHIIANSSFSWWGAWLNPSPEKIVVAPARWFAQADLDTRDLIPPSWVKL